MQPTMTQETFECCVKVELENINNALYFAKPNSSQRVIVAEILHRVAWLLGEPEVYDNLLKSIKRFANLGVHSDE